MNWTPWLVPFEAGAADANDFAASLLAKGFWVTEPTQTDLLLYSVTRPEMLGLSLLHPMTRVLQGALGQGEVIVGVNQHQAFEGALHQLGVVRPRSSALFRIDTGDEEAAEALRQCYGPWTWARGVVRRLRLRDASKGRCR